MLSQIQNSFGSGCKDGPNNIGSSGKTKPNNIESGCQTRPNNIWYDSQEVQKLLDLAR
jgi:hypothetical protein